MEKEIYLPALIGTVSQLVLLAAELPQNPAPEKRGGYLTVRRTTDGTILLVAAIGELNPEKIEKYREFSAEKAERLLTHTAHFSSWQSRDESQQRWGGAIRLAEGHCIFSFSGLPELVDEAVMIALAYLGGFNTTTDSIHVASISSNIFSETLLRSYQQWYNNLLVKTGRSS